VPKEPKRNDKQLIDSEEKYRNLINNVTDIILELDLKGYVNYVSPQCYNIMGYHPIELIGKKALSFIHSEDVLKIAEAMREAVQTKELISVPRYKLLHKNGDIIFASAIGRYVNTNGTERFIVTIRDITVQTRIEQKLKESEEKYRSLINNLTDIILELDIKGTLTYISPQCSNIIGYHPTELVGKTGLKFLHPEDISKVAESMINARNTKELITAPDFRLLHKNGNTIFASARGRHVITDGMDRYIVTLRDISATTKIEQKLRESEEKYRLISENANDLISIFNEQLQFEYINQKSFLNILGYKCDELIGMDGLNFIHPDDSKRVLNEFLQSDKKSEGSIEARVKHKNGHYLTIETNGKQFTDKDGNRKIIVIARDITERKKAENIILAENKKLSELSEIKSELVMRASHEFKTPLSSIYAASQILLNRYREDFDPNALEFIEMIYRGSQKLRQLIENLLDVSKVESGKLNLNLYQENLVEVIFDCCNDLRYWIDKRNIIIKTELPKEVNIEIDRILILQVLTNLLSNAIKYTPLHGNVFINLNVKDQWVDLSIRDTGIGLTKEEMESLFQKFKKFPRISESLDLENEGSGLGLYISKEIIELHGGKIFVESEGRNKGSTFTLRLPRS
jgi:PAS domain S-box-containing protein